MTTYIKIDGKLYAVNENPSYMPRSKSTAKAIERIENHLWETTVDLKYLERAADYPSESGITDGVGRSFAHYRKEFQAAAVALAKIRARLKPSHSYKEL